MATKSSTIRLYSRLSLKQSLTTSKVFGPGYNTEETQLGYEVFSNTRTGVSLPKWRSTIKSGGSATTAMTGTKVSRLSWAPIEFSCGFNPTLGDDRTYVEDVKGDISAMIVPVTTLSGASVTIADNLAISKAFDAVKQQRNQFQGLTALGELRETIQMLKRPFAGVRKYVDQYFNDLRKSQKGRTGKSSSRSARKQSLIETASGAWLEVAFGVKPLLSDAKAAAEAIARYQFDSRRAVVTGKGEDSVAEDTIWTDSVGNYTLFKIHRIVRTTQQVRYKVALDYTRSADFGSNSRLLELVGFTPENFIPTLYELVPWSFLVDYFSNLGKVIEAGCMSQSDVKWVNRTQRRVTVSQYYVNPYMTQAVVGGRFWSRLGQNGESLLQNAIVARTASSTLPIPSLMLSLPGKASQWENMVALWGAQSRSLTKGLRI